jgi:hypothetical protein
LEIVIGINIDLMATVTPYGFEQAWLDRELVATEQGFPMIFCSAAIISGTSDALCSKSFLPSLGYFSGALNERLAGVFGCALSIGVISTFKQCCSPPKAGFTFELRGGHAW